MSVGLGSEDTQANVNAITLCVLLLSTCIVIGNLFKKSRWMTESVTALAIGLSTGFIILVTTGGKSSHILVFDEQLFFIYLLPPIIFNAGFQVKKKQFFRNFWTIILFGAVGTLMSFSVISLGAFQLLKNLDIGTLETADYFALGAIFTATDSVCTLQVLNQDETPLLYSLVFGEGVVNDATTIVLFNAIKRYDLSHLTPTNLMQFSGSFLYMFLISTLLGVAVGLATALLIKKLYHGRESTDGEVALMILMAYLSYMIAELCSLSGILGVFFCGIVMSHYAWHIVTDESRVTTKHAFATLSFISEIFIFLYVGMDALDIEKWKVVQNSPGTSFAVSSILFFLVLLGRAAFVFPLSFLSNLARKTEKIGFKQQVTILWSGLMRGAVSVALAYNQFTLSGHTQLRGNATMITSTISVVLFTNVVCGLLTKHLVRCLLPREEQTRSTTFDKKSSPQLSLNSPLLSNLEDPEYKKNPSFRMILTTSYSPVHHYWKEFDNTYMRPVFGGPPHHISSSLREDSLEEDSILQ